MLIVAALTTIASGLAPINPAPWLNLTVLGIVLAAITTTLATVRQSFDWEGKARTYRDNVFDISQSQSEVQRYLEAVARRIREESDELIGRLESRAEAWMKSDLDDAEDYRKSALRMWESLYISTIQLAPLPPGSPPAAPAVAQPEPEPELDEGGDLQPIVRGGAGQ
jgi:hypothetical protein